MSGPTRQKARIIAFQFLYGSLPEPLPDGPPRAEHAFDKAAFEQFCASFSYSVDDYSWEVVEGVGKNLPILDGTISRLSTHWRIERMPRVDLSILRLTAFEILFRPDIPKSVAINEAVKLAKAYGEKDSPSFVNGLLDRIAKPS
ncbi:MAG: transcription antitermination factor NusB [Deltaproteobacteria bacterium]|nr:transcription antitermination factor NusB [Deltaproteobacteria bacterium]